MLIACTGEGLVKAISTTAFLPDTPCKMAWRRRRIKVLSTKVHGAKLHGAVVLTGLITYLYRTGQLIWLCLVVVGMKCTVACWCGMLVWNALWNAGVECWCGMLVWNASVACHSGSRGQSQLNHSRTAMRARLDPNSHCCILCPLHQCLQSMQSMQAQWRVPTWESRAIRVRYVVHPLYISHALLFIDMQSGDPVEVINHTPCIML